MGPLSYPHLPKVVCTAMGGRYQLSPEYCGRYRLTEYYLQTEWRQRDLACSCREEVKNRFPSTGRVL